MRIYDLREYIYDVCCRYFKGANVMWAGETQPKQKLPLVMLSLRNLSVPHHANIETVKEEIVRYYQSEIMLEVNVFSAPGIGGHNDTVPDMYEFIKYLNSDEIVDELFANDISITLAGSIQNASQFLGIDTEYRAMAEFTVGFCQLSTGAYGISLPSMEKRYDTASGIWAVKESVPEEEWKPTTAGGGSYDMENYGDYEITTAEITMKEEQYGDQY